MKKLSEKNWNLVHGNTELVYYFAIQNSRRGVPDDLLYDAGFDALCDAAHNFDPTKGKFSSYASKAITRRMKALIDEFAKRVKTGSLDDLVGENGDSRLGDFIPDKNQHPDEDVEQNDLQETTNFVLCSLSNRERLVFEECCLERRECPEVAEEYGVKDSSIKKIKERVMRKMSHGIRWVKHKSWIDEKDNYDLKDDIEATTRTNDRLTESERDKRKNNRLNILATAFSTKNAPMISAHVVSELISIKEKALKGRKLSVIQKVFYGSTRNLDRHLLGESLEKERKLFLLACVNYNIGKQKAVELFKQLEMDYARFSDWNEVLLAWAIDKGLNVQECLDLYEKVLAIKPMLNYSLPEKQFDFTTRNTQTEQDDIEKEWMGKLKNAVNENKRSPFFGFPLVVSQIAQRENWYHTISLTKRNTLFNDILGEYTMPSIASEQAFNGTTPKAEYKKLIEFSNDYKKALGAANVRFDPLEELICLDQREKPILRNTLVLIMGLKQLSLDYMNARLAECGFPPINKAFKFDRVHTQHTI